MPRILFLIILALSLSACSTQFGPASVQQPTQYMHLHPGVSTKVDVYQRFGQPHDVRQQPQGSVWHYLAGASRISGVNFIPFVGVAAGGQHITSFHAAFTFDVQGRLQAVETREARRYAHNWAELANQMQDGRAPGERVAAELSTLQLPYDPAIARKIKSFQKATH